ncbi:helix-turn-helix transcriptional regulator [Tropicimonas sp. IMCC34011]|uniref:helix-turn-helix transcriptional regulator n=1 Tax=Tropicimonas sp. IMCC34011 TaxID=2248759 RepID=UPI000E22DEB6|nr:AraC family transcriptional regulator [Tropicimonas sp. IMCC34011]
MRYRHDFTGVTEQIHCTLPVRWHLFETVLGVYWQAEGTAESRGYYLSANPRLSIFFGDVSSIEVQGAGSTRPMARAMYVPAGMPLRTAFTKPLALSHLDIHIDAGWAVQFLSSAMPRASAIRLLEHPAECDDLGDLEAVARLLVSELDNPSRPDIYAQSLAGSLICGILDIGSGADDPTSGRLTAAQMRKITARFEAGGRHRMSIAEMAATVNLSESWFSRVFKATTGVTPHQWQLTQRIERARTMLSETTLSVTDIADQLGFSDQAHLTRAFRQEVGETPAAWRRRRLAA